MTGTILLLGAAAVAATVLLFRSSATKAAADREFQLSLEYLLWLESQLHHAEMDGCNDELCECLRRELSRVSHRLAAGQVDGWRKSGRRASQLP
jgi:hypothetical protein